MKPLSLALGVILVLLIICPSGYAAETAPTPTAATAQRQEDDRLPIYRQDEWQVFLSPYLWIPGLNITSTSLKGTRVTDIPWWDTASALFSNTMGIMGRAEVWKGRWGIYLDGYYTYVGASGSQVGASKDISFGPVDFTLNKQVNLGGIMVNVPVPGRIGPGNITLIPAGSVKYISRLGNLDLGARFWWAPGRLRPKNRCRRYLWKSWGGPGSTPSISTSGSI